MPTAAGSLSGVYQLDQNDVSDVETDDADGQHAMTAGWDEKLMAGVGANGLRPGALATWCGARDDWCRGTRFETRSPRDIAETSEISSSSITRGGAAPLS